MNADIVGWIGNLFFFYGTFALARKNIFGFYSNSVGNALYIWYGFIVGTSSIWMLSS